MSAKRTTPPSRRPSKAEQRDVPSRGRADLARLRRVSETEIARTSPPELAGLPEDFWDDAVPVAPRGKTPISLRVDSDVLAWFRELGPRYQSRMNAVLRSYMERVSERQRRRPRGRKAG